MARYTIIHRVSVELGSSQLTVVQAPKNTELEIKELLLIIDLNSIAEIANYVEEAYLSEDAKNALFWKQALTGKSKKVVTWIEKNNQTIRLIDFFIFNRQPYYVDNLLVRYTGLPTLTLEPGTKILVSVENTNSGLLSAGDYLTIWGQSETN